MSLIRRKKKNFFNNISTRDITDNKTFWKTVKPLFADKVATKSKITLIEKRLLPEKGNRATIDQALYSSKLENIPQS